MNILAENSGSSPLQTATNKRARPVPWPVVLSAAFVLIFSAAYNILVFDRAPHIHDEIAYLFQARIFLTGHLAAPPPCVPEAFDFPHMVNVGRWYSIYPPGFPFLLTIGLLFGTPWLINPLLGAASIFIFYLLGVEIYGRRTGTMAAVLGALSIWLLLMSATMMSHTASMFFNATALLYIFKSFRSPTSLNGLLAGFSIGAAFLVRPYNAVLFVLPFLLALAILSLRELKGRWKSASALVLVAGCVCSLYLLYNASTTGDPLTPGYIARYGKAYSVIFGRPATQDSDFTPLLASAQIGANLKAINAYLYGWPLTSLWPLAFTIWGVARRRKSYWREGLLLSGLLSMIIGFYFFWGAFVVLGARMFFDAVPILCMLSARGLVEAPGLLSSRFPRVRSSSWRSLLIGVIALSSLYAFLIRFPRWVNPSWTKWPYSRYDSSMCGSTAWIHNALTSLGLPDSVVVMKFLYSPLTGFPTGWWGSGFSKDSPRLDGHIIYANDVGDEATRDLMKCFPSRSFYYYMGTLEKGVLFPLRQENGSLETGTPLVSLAHPRRSIELLNSPEKIFTLYSPHFSNFLRSTLQTEGWQGIDVERLRSLANRYWEQRDFGNAAFALEAALQVEIEPRIRWLLLGELIQAYAKVGQTAEAKRIMAKVQEVINKGSAASSLFSVFPARGF